MTLRFFAIWRAAWATIWGSPLSKHLERVRSLSPFHTGMSYERLEAMQGLQWPCYDENHPGEQYLHGRFGRGR